MKKDAFCTCGAGHTFDDNLFAQKLNFECIPTHQCRTKYVVVDLLEDSKQIRPVKKETTYSNKTDDKNKHLKPKSTNKLTLNLA